MCDVIRVYHWVVVYHWPVDDCNGGVSVASIQYHEYALRAVAASWLLPLYIDLFNACSYLLVTGLGNPWLPSSKILCPA